jgi:hypothetical protein
MESLLDCIRKKDATGARCALAALVVAALNSVSNALGLM